MDTIYIETQPSPEKNVSSVTARLGNFDLMGPLRGPNLYVELLNPNGAIFDSTYVAIQGDDWQNWPCNLTPQEDYEYLSSVILRILGLSKRLKSPFFVKYPISQYAVEGSSFVISCEVDGNPKEFNYQWTKNSGIIPSATGSSLDFSNVVTGDAGNYAVIVNNTQGEITGYAFVEVIPLSVPTIIVQPVNTVLASGSFGQVYVTANGVPAPSYQWNKDSEAVSGATGASLYINNMQPEYTGLYNVTVYNTLGSITSDTVELSISQALATGEMI
jgi:hypothetical protein